MMESINVVIDDSAIEQVTNVETVVAAFDQPLDMSFNFDSKLEESNSEQGNVLMTSRHITLFKAK
ncbi:hypothetical protein A2U01_0093900, partial [Trifolium medium]|nr:hypothetical protein [Trifolium medium]